MCMTMSFTPVARIVRSADLEDRLEFLCRSMWTNALPLPEPGVAVTHEETELILQLTFDEMRKESWLMAEDRLKFSLSIVNEGGSVCSWCLLQLQRIIANEVAITENKNLIRD